MHKKNLHGKNGEQNKKQEYHQMWRLLLIDYLRCCAAWILYKNTNPKSYSTEYPESCHCICMNSCERRRLGFQEKYVTSMISFRNFQMKNSSNCLHINSQPSNVYSGYHNLHHNVWTFATDQAFWRSVLIQGSQTLQIFQITEIWRPQEARK